MKIKKLEIPSVIHTTIDGEPIAQIVVRSANKINEIIDRLNQEKCQFCGEILPHHNLACRLSKPDKECECGGRVTLEKVCEHCGIFYHPMGESKLKLQRLLEWVEEHITYPDEKEFLLAKIKELMDEN